MPSRKPACDPAPRQAYCDFQRACTPYHSPTRPDQRLHNGRYRKGRRVQPRRVQGSPSLRDFLPQTSHHSVVALEWGPIISFCGYLALDALVREISHSGAYWKDHVEAKDVDSVIDRREHALPSQRRIGTQYLVNGLAAREFLGESVRR